MEKWQGKLIIKDITLQNFRQFEHLSVQFDPELTVFIGINGSGKTTVLEALAKAIRIFPERIQRPDSALDDIRKFFIPRDIKHQALTSEVDINVHFIENEEEKKRWNEDEYRDNILKFREEKSRYRQFAENEIQQASIGYANDPLERRKVEEAIWNDFKIQIKKLEEEFALDSVKIYKDHEISWSMSVEPDLSKAGVVSSLYTIEEIGREIDHLRFRKYSQVPVYLPVMVFYPCAILHENNSVSTLGNYRDPFTAYRDAFDGAPVNLRAFTHWFRAEEGRARETNNSALLDAVQGAIYGLLDDNSSRFSNLHITYQDNDEGELLIYKNDTPLRISQLSSGEKMLFLIVADLARRLAIATPGSSDPCREGSGVALIDEIDLHLHPRWQRRVIPKLRQTFPQVQLVVTTHSPFVLQNTFNKSIMAYLLKADSQIERLQHFSGWDIRDLMYAHYGMTARPPEVQLQIDKMLALIASNETEKLDEARHLLEELKTQLGSEDLAILEAESSFEILSEIL